MTRPLRIMIPGGFYHVTCRGNDRRAIFKDDRDRTVFLEKLQGSLTTYQVEIHAYVLMHNHFHLMVCTPKGNLSEFMRHFNISYTAAYNRRHRRVGHLYQGRYKAIVIDQDSYLLGSIRGQSAFSFYKATVGLRLHFTGTYPARLSFNSLSNLTARAAYSVSGAMSAPFGQAMVGPSIKNFFK